MGVNLPGVIFSTMCPRYITAMVVGDVVNHRQVVGHKKVGQPELALQFHQQVDDLGLDRHIQGRDRFVAHNQFRIAGRARAIPRRWRCPPDISCG